MIETIHLSFGNLKTDFIQYGIAIKFLMNSLTGNHVSILLF